jgi:predicted Zn finger-like uncharacterized protein
MTLRIQCPSCDRQFKVSEDLKGRTVECGACEHRFKLGEEVIVQKRDKFYPGERAKKGLERYGRAPSAGGGSGTVRFETAAYNQTSSPLDVIPMSPQEWFSTLMGGCILVMAILIFVWGTQPEGVLKDMEVGKRTVLAGFMVVVGGVLIAYGCRHRRKKGLLLGLPLSVGVIALSLLLPVPRTLIPVYGELDSDLGDDPKELPVVAKRKTAEEVRELIGYSPVERAIKSHEDDPGEAADYVSVIWAPIMEERYKFQLLRYLQRKTKSTERPIFYRRDEGGIFVIEGPKFSIEQIADIAERFSRVEEIYHDIRVIEVTLEPARMGDVTEDLLRELSDTTHPAFYARNQHELDHIDLDRVKEAVQRLAAVEPLRFRVEISRRMMGLLEEETDPELRADLCSALKVWAEEGDESDRVVVGVARRMQALEQTLPRSMVEFLVQRQSSEAVSLIEPLWVADPVSWESIIAEIGPAAEDAILSHLKAQERGLQQSAIRILKRIGGAKSLGPLRAALDKADDETKLLLKEVIENVEAGS